MKIKVGTHASCSAYKNTRLVVSQIVTNAVDVQTTNYGCHME